MHLISFSPPASPASSASPAYPPHKIALLPTDNQLVVSGHLSLAPYIQMTNDK